MRVGRGRRHRVNEIAQVSKWWLYHYRNTDLLAPRFEPRAIPCSWEYATLTTRAPRPDAALYKHLPISIQYPRILLFIYIFLNI